MADITTERSPWKRAVWFVLLWAGGVAAVSLVALAIRAVLVP